MTNHERRDLAQPFRTSQIIQRLRNHLSAGYTPQPGGSASDDTLEVALAVIERLSRPATGAVDVIADILGDYAPEIGDLIQAAEQIADALARAGFRIVEV